MKCGLALRLFYNQLQMKLNDPQPYSAILISLDVVHAQSHMITRLKSSDSERLVLQFSRATVFC